MTEDIKHHHFQCHHTKMPSLNLNKDSSPCLRLAERQELFPFAYSLHSGFILSTLLHILSRICRFLFILLKWWIYIAAPSLCL